jgi:CO/xanthine dehydrogenase Mo-binding subunit
MKFRIATSSIRARATTCATSTSSYAAAKAKAAKVVKASYTVSYLAHARMEPGNTTAMVTPGRVDLWTGDKWISGVGEEAIPQMAPAIAQAVFKITGKRIRALPLGNHNLSWG